MFCQFGGKGILENLSKFFVFLFEKIFENLAKFFPSVANLNNELCTKWKKTRFVKISVSIKLTNTTRGSCPKNVGGKVTCTKVSK